MPTLRGAEATARLRSCAGTSPARFRSSRSKSSNGSSRLPDVYYELVAHTGAAHFLVALFWHRYLDDSLGIGLYHRLGLRPQDCFKYRPYLLLDLLVGDRSVDGFQHHLLLRHCFKLDVFAQRKVDAGSGVCHLVDAVSDRLVMHVIV